MITPEASYLFEVSWEVCNKVGGIYTVIKSKAQRTMSLYKNYLLIGPYFEHNAKIDFLKLDTPAEYRQTFDALSTAGIDCYYGRWIEVKGKPFCILLDTARLIPQKDAIKEKFWNDYKIDSLRGYWDFEEPCIWAYAAGQLIEKLASTINPQQKIVAHFHEWLGAFGLLHLKKHAPFIGTVFTTHATTLGRTIASEGGRDLYDIINTINPLQEAYSHGIEAKHLTEKCAALNADVFTTVSEITGIEAEHFLGRKPDVLVLNGLDIEKFPSIEETSIKHVTSRDKIREFLTYYFFPYYVFDVSHNLIFYTVGRFEFRNKGYDILIKALGMLNQMLKDARIKNPQEDRTISIFFWIPMQHNGVKLEALENKNYYMHIKNNVMQNSTEILNRLIYDFICQRQDIDQSFMTETFMNEIKKDIFAFERKGNPPMSTHNIDENGNILMRSLREHGLMNRKEDPVKTIVMPIYLDGTDGFLDLNYYDAMAGCHLGLFPSYYEPWGYTPLESAALAVPALTTDLSGFGMFLKNKYPGRVGIWVLERYHTAEQDMIVKFAKIMFDFALLDHAHRVECKLAAKNLAAVADWDFLIEHYVQAHNLALANKNNKG